MVRQEGCAGPDQATARLERDSGGAQQPHCRDQIAADPAARPGRADRRARCHREGAVADDTTITAVILRCSPFWASLEGWPQARLRPILRDAAQARGSSG